jgi:hypothetical protein
LAGRALSLSIQRVPLPVGFEFVVQGKNVRAQYVIRIDHVPLFALNDQNMPAGQNGLCPHLSLILHACAQDNLWGQTLDCNAYERVPTGGGAIAFDPETKSNTLRIHMPVRDLHDLSPGAIALVAHDPQPAPHVLPPAGRRVFWYQRHYGTAAGAPPAPSHLYTGVFLDSENRLEVATRCYDRFSFWLSALGIAANVQSGEALSAKLNGTKPPHPIPMTGTLAEIQAAVGTDYGKLKDCLLWSPTRVVFVRTSIIERMMEFTPSGLTNLPIGAFLVQTLSSETWNVRKTSPVFRHGLASLQS